MTREPFNSGWGYRQPLGPFAAVEGASAVPTPVTLPHDALRDAERAADAPSKGASAYYPMGAFAYLKTLEVPADWTERVVSLEFQGAFRHAMVFVNDQFAGNRADGYARFLVNIKPFLRYGEPNEIRVEVRSGQDSRWYSGSGIAPARLPARQSSAAHRPGRGAHHHPRCGAGPGGGRGRHLGGERRA